MFVTALNSSLVGDLSQLQGSMLAIITDNGTSLIDPASFKNLSTSSFPTSKSLECSAAAWSADNSQLYLVNASSIKRYTPSECLLEDLHHGPDQVTCLEMKDRNSMLFFAAGNKVWLLDYTHSPGKVLSSLEPHKSVVTRLSISNDGTLLASVSASAVLVHNLTLSSCSQLKGLPSKGPITSCLFHQHSRSRLLLTTGRDIVIYDSMRPSSAYKTIRVPGSEDITGLAESPFSKTLVVAITSSGGVMLVDLDKDNGILKTVSMNVPLTCCAFTAEGAAIYLGTESGKLLFLDLRSLEKEPKSITIGDGGSPIKTINVPGKSKSRPPDVTTKARSSSAAVARLSPQRPTSLSRKASVSSVTAGIGIKSPTRVTIAPKIRAGGGVTPKKRLFSPVRSPLSETKNLGLDAQLTTPCSPTLSRHAVRLRLQVNEDRKGSQAGSSAFAHKASTDLMNAKQRINPGSSRKLGQDFERLGLGPAPESISGHLAAMRVRSGPVSNGARSDRMKTATRRITSESVETVAAGRKARPTSSALMGSKPSTKPANDVIRMEKQQELRSTTPDNSGDPLDLSSPELPRGPVSPISLAKAPLASVAGIGIRTLGLTSPEATECVRDRKGKGKGKEKPVEVKKARFVQHEDDKRLSGGSGELESEGVLQGSLEELQDGEQEQELSLQVSPRRPTAPSSWLQSPHRPSTTNINMNVAAQDFLRGIVHEVMYDFQRETKAEMTGLHLDLVRMGRAWKQELRDIMEECNGEIRELKAENRRLKEENERLRRSH